VFYWYQDTPEGFKHEPMEPVEERIRDLVKSSRKADAEGEADRS
jgi:hypothetical protein